MKEEEMASKSPEQDKEHEMHHMAQGHKTPRERHKVHATEDFKKDLCIINTNCSRTCPFFSHSESI